MFEELTSGVSVLFERKATIIENRIVQKLKFENKCWFYKKMVP